MNDFDETQESILDMLKKSNIPPRAWNLSLASPPCPELSSYYSTAKKFVAECQTSENIKPLGNGTWPSRGLLLVGPKRSGKTYLACAMLQALMVKHHEPARFGERKQDLLGYFVNVNNLFSRLQWAMDKKKCASGETAKGIHRLLTQSEFLVLDDLASQRASSWVLSEIYSIINHRHEWLKTTIITSDVKLSDYSASLSDDLRICFERIESRLREMMSGDQLTLPDCDPWGCLRAGNIVEIKKTG